MEPAEEVGIQNVESENPNIGKSTEKVSDEFFPDDVYHGVDGIGQEAFRCFQCRMLYIPTSHVDGNPIVTHEMCRMHIGVCKCVHCAHVLVGLAKIRCHREVCPQSAWYGEGVSPHYDTSIS